MTVLPVAIPVLTEVLQRAIRAHSSFSTPGECHACALNYPVTRTWRFFPEKLARSFASKSCPSLITSPLVCSSPGFVSFVCAEVRLHRLHDDRRPSSGRGGNLSAKEAQGGRRATGMRDHRREYHTLDHLAAAAARIRPPSLAQPCRLLTSVPLLGSRAHAAALPRRRRDGGGDGGAGRGGALQESKHLENFRAPAARRFFSRACGARGRAAAAL